MRMFTYHLYKKGYLNDAACIPNDTFDFTPFEFSYGREYLKFAAEEFGKDHQEIAKWLYTSDLKSVARFGCPSLCQKSVYAAKYLRRCFRIEEHKVCQKCILKESCKLANKRYKKVDTKLYLVNVIRVLFMYALESTPQQLVVPKKVKISVNRVLEKVIHLSEELSHDDSSVPPSLRHI
ncbi:hypothetical protein ACJIZ3_007173 [Penstemon smallii]|uniref:Uncharacterized protein n=1 Tax=Penstemon smallii TaxID=265156 RepID=A0ABD3SA23_9LAMI